jgi:hypothetical protein
MTLNFGVDGAGPESLAKQYVNENLKIFLMKSKKSENHLFNKVRENIIQIFLTYFHVDIKWGEANKLFENFKRTLCDFGVVKIIQSKTIGGRNNTDFELEYIGPRGSKHYVKLEFKNGTLVIDDIPQFLQLYTNNKETYLFQEEYHKFYYDYYLGKVIQLLESKDVKMEKPSYKEYLSGLNDTKKNTFHKILYEKGYKKYKSEINKIVKESISCYLDKMKNKRMKIDILNQKLEKQKDKVYLLTKDGEFKIESIQDYMKVKSFRNIKNGNTLVLNTIRDAELHCLLRWKNGNGCRGPAWQISLVKKEAMSDCSKLSGVRDLPIVPTSAISYLGLHVSKHKEFAQKTIWNELDDMEEFCREVRRVTLRLLNK